jgi:hypothetical protein
MKKLIIVLLFLSIIKMNGQDVSGATAGAMSTTLHTNQTSSVKKPKEVIYVFSQDKVVPNTFVIYNGEKLPVYKTKDGKLYFIADKRKIYFKKK